MKKKIAVFSTGWSAEILHNYVKGICDGLKEISADVYLFMGFPTLGDSEDFLRGELNIFHLPDLKDFDIVFVLANGLDFPGVKEQINERCEAAGIPVIYTGNDDGVHYFVGADNYIGAKALAEHLVTEHQAKDILFIAGGHENVDSNTRFQALSDVMSAHGMRITQEQIFYSDWSPKNTIYFMREWLDQERRLPDAIVCANDSLAMVVCSELRDHNIKVPEEVAVTGFDNESVAGIYDPSISSVDQRFDKIGNAVAKLAIRLLQGETCERVQTIPCEFVPSESCGCVSAKDFSSIRREVGRNKFLDAMNDSAFNRSLSEMERKILQGHAYADIRENIKIIIDSLHNYEGDSFHLILDPLFEETTMDTNKKLRISGYPGKMDVIFSRDERELSEVKNFKTRNIVPFIKNKRKNHFFLCSPLHDNGGLMGYVVFGDNVDRLKDTERVQIYLDRLNNILIKYKQTLSVDFLNRKLLELSETDALTHVKNRTAYQARKEQIDVDLKNDKNTEFAVVLCDINGLKQINDYYGHEAGDDYIINSCKLICNVFKRSAVYRIGGDEFVIILMGSDYRSRYKLLKEFGTKMAKLQEQDLPLCEKISIASGLADYDPDVDTGVDSVLHRADLRMYENKQSMKSSRL